ncbi:MAG TPA: hypothetical protein VF618_11925 [Thermoanaerobaculia bacterium]
MSNSTKKSIADKEAASSHHVAEERHPGHARNAGVGPGARDERARQLEAEVKQRAKKK